MKKLGLIAVAMLMASCCGTPKVGRYQIEGEIANLKDSVEVGVFSYESPFSRTLLYRDTIIDGRLSISDTISCESRLISIKDMSEGAGDVMLDLYVAPGSHIKISGEGATSMCWSVESDNPDQASVARYYDALGDQILEIDHEMKRAMKVYDQNIKIVRSDSEDIKKREEANSAIRSALDGVRELSDTMFVAQSKYRWVLNSNFFTPKFRTRTHNILN